MTDLDRYNMVNKCETLDQLANVILSIAENGRIQGRTRSFSSAKMALAAATLDQLPKLARPIGARALTRRWGIRQQAFYILAYED